MNFGANVPGAGDPPLVDDDRFLEFDRTSDDENPMSAREFVREWPAVAGLGNVGCITEDLDRACPGGGPGDGDALFLPKGLLRHLGPGCA